MKKYTVVGFYELGATKGYTMGEFDSITEATNYIDDEWKLDPEVDINYYIIMKSEEATEYEKYW